MDDISWLSRTQLLIGEPALRQLTNKHVMVVGMGGVGSFAAEFIARSGIGKMTIIDGDVVDPTNRNRQLPALATNHGEPKVQIMARRIKEINPEIELNVIQEFVNPDIVAEQLNFKPDYIIDAIDSITPKLTFMKLAYESRIPMVSSMGAGGKVDPTRLYVVDISKTYNCPFAHQIRKRLRKMGIRKGIKAVFSDELPDPNSIMLTDGSNFKKSAYGTISYIPATFGAVVASVAIRDLMKT
jgi:tRNA A37 threonylcarbamoyladenosine dehydratase